MKKKNRMPYYWSAGIILFVVAGWFIFNYAMTAFEVGKIVCTYGGNGTFNCSPNSVRQIIGDSSQINGTFLLNIDNPIAISRDQYTIFTDFYNKTNPKVGEFFSKNLFCERSGVEELRFVTADLLALCSTKDCGGTKTPAYATLEQQWVDLLGVSVSTAHHASDCPVSGLPASSGDPSDPYVWMYATSASGMVNKIFPNQIIVINATMWNDNSNPTITEDFMTYGLCNFSSGSCIVQEPSVIKAFGTNRYVAEESIHSMKIYLNPGGYDLNNFCVTNGVEKCTGTTLYVCETQGLVNKGQVAGKCGVALANSSTSTGTGGGGATGTGTNTNTSTSTNTTITKYICSDGSLVTDTTKCPKDNSKTWQYVAYGATIISSGVAIWWYLGRKKKR